MGQIYFPPSEYCVSRRDYSKLQYR